MFSFLKPKPPEQPKKSTSLFSTQVELDINNIESPEQYIWDQAIRRTDQDFKPVNSKGKPVKSAMDAGGSDAFKPQLEQFNSLPFAQLAWYSNQTFCGYQIAAILSQHWLIDKACTMPARDAMRHGYELTVDDGEKVEPKTFDKIKQLDKKFRLNDHAVEFARFNRIFGIRIAIFKIQTNDPLFYEKPFNIDGIKKGSYQGIVQVDPYWVTPELDSESATDPSSLHFYEPTWWRISGKRYHRSHLIIIKNGIVPDVLKPSYLWGGVSIPQKIAERVFAAERTANEAPMLAATKRSTVWHMPMVEATANLPLFYEKLKFFANTRDNYGVKAMDLSDIAEQFDTSLADLDSVIMTQYQLVSAIADVPATKLLGTSPKGFNATGEFESDSYHEFLESVQSHDIEPLLERHYELLMKSEGFGLNVQIAWNPVDSPTGKELANINLVKAQTDSALAQAGAIDGVDIRDRIIKDEDSGYSGIPDTVPEMETVENDDGEENRP